MSVTVSDAVPGFDFLAFFGVIAVVLGAFYGGYCCWTLGLDVAQATKATAYGTLVNVQYCRRFYSESSTNLASTVWSWVDSKMDFWYILCSLCERRKHFLGLARFGP
jgi:hypothetical protein